MFEIKEEIVEFNIAKPDGSPLTIGGSHVTFLDEYADILPEMFVWGWYREPDQRFRWTLTDMRTGVAIRHTDEFMAPHEVGTAPLSWEWLEVFLIHLSTNNAMLERIREFHNKLPQLNPAKEWKLFVEEEEQMTEQVKEGLYKHYKGTVYEVVAVAEGMNFIPPMFVPNEVKHSETLEPLTVWVNHGESYFIGEGKLVIYTKDNETYWARPLEMFTENVTVDGQEVPRFEYMGEVQ